MNFWKQNPEFWQNKTQNPRYKEQRAELVSDIKSFIDALDITTVIDVCGYRGEIGKMLPKVINYINLDIVNGFDVTHEWTHQLVERNIVLDDPENVLAFTSLSLLCFRPEAAQHIINQMKKYSSIQYYYEEKLKQELLLSDTDNYAQVNDDFGGKWTYNWEKFIGNVDLMESKVGPWVRIFSK